MMRKFLWHFMMSIVLFIGLVPVHAEFRVTSEEGEITLLTTPARLPDQFNYQVRPGTVAVQTFTRRDGTTYKMPAHILGQSEIVPFKIDWKGVLVYDRKNASGTYTRVRDPKIMIGLREDGIMVWKSTP